MTTPINSYNLAWIRATSESCMMDYCTINAKTVTTGSYGEPIETTGSLVSTPCGITFVGGKQIWNAENKALVYSALPFDATIRLPADTVIDATNTITITKRLGEDITPLTFEVVSSPKLGLTGLLVDVRRVG